MANLLTLEELAISAEYDLSTPRDARAAVVLKWAVTHARMTGVLKSRENQLRASEAAEFDMAVRASDPGYDAEAHHMQSSMSQQCRLYLEEQAAIVQLCANVLDLLARGLVLPAKVSKLPPQGQQQHQSPRKVA